MKAENESRQMYLKTILKLSKSGQRVRKIDIAKELCYSKPSITSAVRKLVADGMVTDIKGEISLTDKGKEIAEMLNEKNTVLTTFFIELGAESSIAEENACRIEHVITDEMFDIIRKNALKQDSV